MTTKDSREDLQDRLNEAVNRVNRSAQIVLSFDGVSIIAEMAGLNGATRRKITLDPNFLKRNPELHAVLADEVGAIRIRAMRARAQVASSEPEPDRTELNRQAHQANLARYKAWYDGLTAADREREDARRATIETKNKNNWAARERAIYLDVIAKHGDVRLANNVIPDPSARPSRKIRVWNSKGEMREISPRNQKELDAHLEGKKIRRPRASSLKPEAKFLETAEIIDLDGNL